MCQHLDLFGTYYEDWSKELSWNVISRVNKTLKAAGVHSKDFFNSMPKCEGSLLGLAIIESGESDFVDE